ncbi:MAG: FAD-binding oxidoreductase [Myxococcales bacterium]|nr:FAD-binding oxidoreductase [Myxococcales bacterium]
MAPLPLVAELRQLLGADAVTTDPDDLRAWGRDWTRVAEPRPCAVCWPRDTAGVVAVVRLCGHHGVSIVPSGGRTGLAGGALAAAGELVLSLDRLRDLGPVDPLGRTVAVGAGVPNQLVQEHCAPHALWWPVELASKGSCSVGGNLATNAGGVRVIRYGHARQWVVGLDVVTADGDVLRLGGACLKDNVGPDLKQLFIGSEGTLGVITAATLRLAPLPGPTIVALVAVASATAALDVLAAARAAGIDLMAFEFVSSLCLDRVHAHTGLPRPFGVQGSDAVLVEWIGDDTGWLERLARTTSVPALLGLTRADARRLWQYRERVTESLGSDGAPHKNDIAVAVPAIAALARDIETLWAPRQEGVALAVFGHLGDGSLHINALRPGGVTEADWAARCRRADEALYDLVVKHGGSIAAEHGVGLVKQPYGAWTGTAAAQALRRALKLAFDPRGLLNPGKGPCG